MFEVHSGQFRIDQVFAGQIRHRFGLGLRDHALHLNAIHAGAPVFRPLGRVAATYHHHDGEHSK